VNLLLKESGTTMAERSQDGPEQNRQQPAEDRASSSSSGGDDDKPNKRNKVGTSNINWEELFVREAANPILASVSFRVGKDGTPVPVIPFVLASRAPFFGCLLSKDGITEEFKSIVEEFLREFEPEIFRIFLYVRFD
jgi:hypothetical protein